MRVVLSFLISLLSVLCVIGWVKNIIALITMTNSEITTLFILRIVGIFAAPLGVVLGWFF
jgi:hypothetical protein